ncbi:hypothetical protein DPMN_130498 [Dreissena polymorpha]|uniref:Uncharacterized protein n=1 Tax=Dreissena polymorpha TaxID=45954 RepID=A0A9D4H4N9_DREPO|nr:hypothetical protein DPMN_130498 [Dreissena polymorpha]
MEPCGTPQEMFSDDEKVPDTSTSCFLSDKYDCNHIVNIIIPDQKNGVSLKVSSGPRYQKPSVSLKEPCLQHYLYHFHL